MARETGISEVETDLRPQVKLARVHALAGQGAIVARVGDGVNDAAALAAAHVSARWPPPMAWRNAVAR